MLVPVIFAQASLIILILVESSRNVKWTKLVVQHRGGLQLRVVVVLLRPNLEQFLLILLTAHRMEHLSVLLRVRHLASAGHLRRIRTIANVRAFR